MNILVTHCNTATGPWCPHFTTWRDQSNLGQKRQSASGFPNASDTRFKEISSSRGAHLRKGIIEFYTFFPWSKGNGFHVDLEQGTTGNDFISKAWLKPQFHCPYFLHVSSHLSKHSDCLSVSFCLRQSVAALWLCFSESRGRKGMEYWFLFFVFLLVCYDPGWVILGAGLLDNFSAGEVTLCLDIWVLLANVKYTSQVPLPDVFMLCSKVQGQVSFYLKEYCRCLLSKGAGENPDQFLVTFLVSVPGMQSQIIILICLLLLWSGQAKKSPMGWK